MTLAGFFLCTGFSVRGYLFEVGLRVPGLTG
jgi:hypothetical protein